MKTVILAGGRGTRLAEETVVRPKPMVDIGAMPILWHIMKLYSHYGLNDFILCLGYKGYLIKEFFVNYYLHMSDLTVDLAANSIDVHQNAAEPWRVALVETGEETMTGGRMKRVADYLDDEPFCMTYGDGLADVDIGKLIAFHNAHGKLATVTAVRPPGRYGDLTLADDTVTNFDEKPPGDGGWVSGGFFVLSPKVIDYIDADQTHWEREPLSKITREGQLVAYRHDGFWGAMDTLRDKMQLEDMWQAGVAPWRVW